MAKAAAVWQSHLVVVEYLPFLLRVDIQFKYAASRDEHSKPRMVQTR